MGEGNSRGQAWSIDLVIGVLIFLLVVGVFYVLLRANLDNDTTELKVSSEVIAMKLVNDPSVGIISEDSVDDMKLKSRLDQIREGGYEDLKEQLGVNTEFCIFFEDADGNIIKLRDTEGKEYTGIGPGTNDLEISGTPCGGQIT